MYRQRQGFRSRSWRGRDDIWRHHPEWLRHGLWRWHFQSGDADSEREYGPGQLDREPSRWRHLQQRHDDRDRQHRERQPGHMELWECLRRRCLQRIDRYVEHEQQHRERQHGCRDVWRGRWYRQLGHPHAHQLYRERQYDCLRRWRHLQQSWRDGDREQQHGLRQRGVRCWTRCGRRHLQ